MPYAGRVVKIGLAPARGWAAWLRGLPADALAGVSVAMIAIPQSLAYAGLAGMPPIVGLYAVALPPIAPHSSPHPRTCRPGRSPSPRC